MRRRLQLPGPPRRTSRAVLALREAASSPCPTCGRVTKTTSDGVCADCWAHKDGRRYARAAEPSRWAAALLDAVRLRRLRR